jgi:acyl-CoA thioesterase I
VTKVVFSIVLAAATLVPPAALADDGGAAIDAPVAGGGPVIKVACAGEHSTNSVYVADGDEYPARLQALLGTGYQVMNFGYPRATVQTEGITFPNAMALIQTMEFSSSVAYAPDIVILGPFGRHDSAANYADPAAIDRPRFTAGLEAIVRAYQALPSKPTIYLALPIPYPSGTGEGVMSAVVLPATRDVARSFHLPVIDHWSVFLGKGDLFSNADHFTPDGIQRMAEVVRDSLASAGDAGAPSAPPDAASPPAARSSGCAVARAPARPWGLALVVVTVLFRLRKRHR